MNLASAVMRIRHLPLVSASSIYLLTNILNAAIPFALVPVFTRYLSPTEYGQVAMFHTFLSGLAAVVGLNAVGAATRKYYDNGNADELAEFVGACLQILAVSSLATFVVVLLLQSQLSQLLGLPPTWLLLAVLASASSFIIQLRLGQWQVRGEPIPYALLQTVLAVANVALSLVLVVLLMRGATGRMEATLWATLALSLAALLLLERSSLIALRWRPGYIREALRFGVPLVPHVGGGFLLLSADRLVIATELGIAEAGIYMLAVQFAQVASLCFDAINKAYVPWLFERLRRDDPEEKLRIVRYTYLWFAVILGGAGLSFIVAPWVIQFMAGPAFNAAGELVGWLVLGQVFGGMYLMVTNYIFYSKKTGLLSGVTVGTGLLNLTLLFVLTGPIGAKGAAWAFCIAMAVRFLLTWWLAQRRHPMPWFATRVAAE